MIPNGKSQKHRFLLVLLALIGALAWILSSKDSTTAGVTPYTQSTHGSPSLGVYRIFMANYGYARGNCAHCHEAHGSLGGVEPDPDQGTTRKQRYLQFEEPGYDQDSGFCLSCHRSSGSLQFGGPVANDDYSKRRGGSQESFPFSVADAFYFIENGTAQPRNNWGYSNGSAHFLSDVRDKLSSNWGWPSGTGRINPCLACHEPHRAKKDWPCSLPDGHDDVYTWEIWGDDPDGDEKMSTASFGGTPSPVYQPPHQVGGALYEWDPDTQEAPNYVQLCMSCHGGPVYSSRYGRNLSMIFWTGVSTQTDKHGSRNGEGTGVGDKKPPYEQYDEATTNLILMCTDCHEPHGSRNYMLLRSCVNGTDNLTITDPGDDMQVQAWCRACHTDTHFIVDCLDACHGHDNPEF